MTPEPEAISAPPVHHLAPRYLDPNHWARGPKSKSGATSEKLIYMAVGHALSNWEHVEAAASMLFSHFVEGNSTAAARAYGSILGARAREAALRQASETFFLLRRTHFKRNSSVRDAVRAMEKTSGQLVHNYGLASSRRNDIAHGVAWELSFKDQKQLSWFLVAPNYQSSKTENWIEDDIKLRSKKDLRLSDAKARFDYNRIYYKNSEYVYGTKEIKVFAGKFAYLNAELLSFFHVLDPQRMRFTPAELANFAKHMSA